MEPLSSTKCEPQVTAVKGRVATSNASVPDRDSRNKYGRLDPAPERTGIIRPPSPHFGENENGDEGCNAYGEEGCKANCESICLAISCVVDCCPHKFVYKGISIKEVKSEGSGQRDGNFCGVFSYRLP